MLKTIAERIIDRYPEMYDRLCEYIARVECAPVTQLSDDDVIEVANGMPSGFLWWDGCGHEAGILIEEAIDFAHAIAAKVTKDVKNEGTRKTCRHCRRD